MPVSWRALALAVMTLTTLTLALLAGPSTAGRRPGLCGHHNVHVLAQRGAVAIYVYRGAGGLAVTQVCARGKASIVAEAPAEAVQPTSIAITDNAVGYATEVCDPQEQGLQRSPCITIVGRNGGRVATITSAVDPTPPRSQITRLRIAASGAFAWISCHRKGPKAGEADPATQPGCLTTGRRHYVYALPADAPDRSTPVLLASATGISPRRLSIGKRRVTWRVGKRLRSAPIPPSNSTPATASPK